MHGHAVKLALECQCYDRHYIEAQSFHHSRADRNVLGRVEGTLPLISQPSAGRGWRWRTGCAFDATLCPAQHPADSLGVQAAGHVCREEPGCRGSSPSALVECKMSAALVCAHPGGRLALVWGHEHQLSWRHVHQDTSQVQSGSCDSSGHHISWCMASCLEQAYAEVQTLMTCQLRL